MESMTSDPKSTCLIQCDVNIKVEVTHSPAGEDFSNLLDYQVLMPNGTWAPTHTGCAWPGART